jgi:integrase
MPRPRKPARIYRRRGRPGLVAYISRDEPNVALGTDDDDEAQVRLAAILQSRRLQAVDPGDRPLAEVFAEHHKRSKTNHARSTAYVQNLNRVRILAWLDGHGIASARHVTAEVVEDYKTSRRFARERKRGEAKGVGAARINSEINTWVQVTRIAIEWGLVDTSALAAFKKLREPRAQPHRTGLTKAELERFLRAEPDAGHRAHFRVIIGSGIRDAEALHMQASDIQPPWLVVTPKPPGACECCPAGWNTKGYRYRSIPISKATAKAARSYVAAKADMQMDSRTIWGRVQDAAKAAGIKKHISLHDFRRAWASHMLLAGHMLQDISRWLGHADVMTTMRYLRVVTDATPDPKSLPF